MNYQKFTTIVDTLLKKKYRRNYSIKKILEFFNIPEKQTKKANQEQLFTFLYKQKKHSPELKYLMKFIKKKTPYYIQLLVNVLHELIYPPILQLEKKLMKDEIYKNLIEKKKQNNLTDDESKILDVQLHLKFCKCIKKLYLRNLYYRMFFNKESSYNPYAVCTSSLYKNRDFDVPPGAAMKCKQYKWYREA